MTASFLKIRKLLIFRNANYIEPKIPEIQEGNRLDYQPLLGKRARAPPLNSLLGEERTPDSRKRRKSSLGGKFK